MTKIVHFKKALANKKQGGIVPPGEIAHTNGVSLEIPVCSWVFNSPRDPSGELPPSTYVFSIECFNNNDNGNLTLTRRSDFASASCPQEETIVTGIVDLVNDHPDVVARSVADQVFKA